MVRIETGDRLGPAQVRPARETPQATERAAPGGTAGPSSPGDAASRALVVIDGGRSERPDRAMPAERLPAGRSRAGFIAQLLTSEDPTLLPSRPERTRMAAARYAEAARRLA